VRYEAPLIADDNGTAEDMYQGDVAEVHYNILIKCGRK
jgi:hypothetical protein